MKRLVHAIFLFPFLLNAQTTLPTLWNFSNPTIENPPNGWTTGLGTNGNFTYSGSQNSVGGDNLSCRLDATGEFVMIQFAERSGPLSYWIKGTGISPNPAFTGSFKIEESVNGTNWTVLREFTTAQPMGGTMARFVDQPAATSRYIRFFYSDKQSGSNVALDSVVLREASACTCPTIALRNNGNPIADGSTFIGGNASTYTFSILNNGTVDVLRIDSVLFEGDAASDFSVSQLPTNINALSNAALAIDFNPGDNGSRIATLKIYSNDTEKNPYTVRIYAIGGTLATEPAQPAQNFNITNVKAFGMDITWQHPSTRPEKYLVLRKKDSPITENPTDGNTYRRGDYIGNAQVLFVSDDQNIPVLKPTYIHANSTYHFKVFAFNGPAGYENYLTSDAPHVQSTTPSKKIDNYYSGINSAANNFVTSLSNKIATHDTVFYSLYIPRFVNPFLTRDTTQGRKIVNCVYTELPYVYNEPFLWWTGTNSGLLTREHTYAQSWMPTRNQFSGWPNDNNGRELTEYNDLHNLFPAHQVSGNAIRSNLPFGEVVGIPTYVSPTGLGKKGLNASGVEVWEPRNEQKGDIARALFYMCAAYNGLRGNTWTLPTNQDQAVLKKWHFQDLPDNEEIARHEFIASIQRNRNPFIDSVNFVCRINFSNMTWISDIGTCGIAEPILNITYPLGGEVFNISMPAPADTIAMWNAANIDSVTVLFLVNDTLFKNLGKVKASDGLLIAALMTIPVVTDKAKIRLISTPHNLISESPSYFTFNMSSSLNTLDRFPNINLYPNPSNGIINIDNIEPNASIEIFDNVGRKVEVFTTISTPNLTYQANDSGIYFIKYTINSKSKMYKVIVM